MGPVELTIVELNDHLIILDIDFLEKLRVMPIPYLGSMMLLNNETTCTIPLVEKQKLKRSQK